jgi:hypothetical protein
MSGPGILDIHDPVHCENDKTCVIYGRTEFRNASIDDLTPKFLRRWPDCSRRE